MFEVQQFDTKTISWWLDQYDNIDLNPPYQRKGQLWSNDDKSYLIDSIINGYDIPKIYIANFSYFQSPLNLAKKKYAIIDGKQRMSAIFDFFNDNLRLAKCFTDLQKTFPKVAKKYENFALTVMQVISDDEGKINDLFVRLNRGKPLTGAELRNAMQGVVPNIIREISDNDFFKTKTRFTVTRGQDKNTAAKLLLVEYRGRFVDTKKFHLDRLVQEGSSAQGSVETFERARDRVITVLNDMCAIFSKSDPLLSQQGTITLYYWLVRESKKQDKKCIRQFLVAFNDERNKVKVDGDLFHETIATKSDLITYSLLDRSTNDQGSLEGRYNIIYSSFRKYMILNRK